METRRRPFDSRLPKHSTTPRLIRLVVGLGLVLVFMYMAWQKAQEGPRNLSGPAAIKLKRPADGTGPAETTTPRVHVEPERVIQTQIKNATIRNQDGNVLYRGTIDLKDTFARIERNERASHGNDGSV